MAATGFTPIQIYYSTTASAVPTAGNLLPGELALNIADMKLYCENSSGVVTLLASASGSSGDVVGPASSTDNAIVRFDGTTGKLVQNSAVTVADTTGDITGGAYNKVTVTAPATSATLTIADGKTFTANSSLTLAGVDAKTLTVNNSLTLAGTDGTTMTFPNTSGTVAILGLAQTFTAAQTFQAANAVRVEAATTQDAIVIAGRAGGTGSYAVTVTPAVLSSSTTLTLPNVTDTVATIGTAQTFTAAQTFRAANAIRSEAASTQDAVIIAGRAGGTNSYAATITPTTLTANRTVTIPNEDFTVGFRNVPAVGAQTSAYILTTNDVGKYVEVGTGGSIEIPNSTFASGDVVSVFNNTSAGITITCTITTAYIAGTDADKATVTLATRGVATLLFISGTVCVITGNVS